MSTLELARKGEILAGEYLSGKGFRIIERNWYHRHKELDLVAIDGDELVIVEVKTRQSPVWDDPSKSIDRDKRRNLVIAANAYARKHRIHFEIRFDVVWVVYSGNQQSIDHIANAFVPGL